MINDKEMEKMIGEMADFTAEELSKEQENKERVKIKETLSKLNSMLSSKAFARKCKAQAKKYGVSEKMVKNVYASKILDSIGENTSVVIETLGEAFNYLVRLIAYVLQKVMDFAISALVKLVNIITFRKPVECESVA